MKQIQEIINEIREYLTNIGPGEHVEEDVIADFANRIEKEAKNECRDCEIRQSEVRLREERFNSACYWQKQYDAQGEIMASTARQNVRLRDALNRISLITACGGTVEHECIYKIASEALKVANHDQTLSNNSDRA